jgi:uncharacterized membrane protein
MQVWILLVIIVILIYLYASSSEIKKLVDGMIVGAYDRVALMIAGASANKSTPVEADAGVVASTDASASAPVTTADKKEALERRFIIEGVQNAESASSSVDPCAASTEDVYGDADEGTFKTWMMQTSIDPSTVASHMRYVSERAADPQSQALGVARPAERHEASDAVPWRGLSRPSRVAVGAPDQVPDIDMDQSPATQRFTWDSGFTG